MSRTRLTASVRYSQSANPSRSGRIISLGGPIHVGGIRAACTGARYHDFGFSSSE
nr:MAG TPA: hypothetical protein [Caudoviricetes sp.]